MKSPERTVKQIFSVIASGGKLYASTDSVSYWQGLFGYQTLIGATRPDSVETLMSQTFLDRRESATDRQKVSSS